MIKVVIRKKLMIGIFSPTARDKVHEWMTILIEIYKDGYYACKKCRFSIYGLKDNNPHQYGTVEWQNFRVGYLDCYGRKRVSRSYSP